MHWIAKARAGASRGRPGPLWTKDGGALRAGKRAHNARVQSYALQFTDESLKTGHDLSPVHLPVGRVGRGQQIFRQGSTPLYAGLPGLIADALPDAWGERMLKHELPELRTTLGRLAALGQRASGAITIEPAIGQGGETSVGRFSLAAIAREADAFPAKPVSLDRDAVNLALAHGWRVGAGSGCRMRIELFDTCVGS